MTRPFGYLRDSVDPRDLLFREHHLVGSLAPSLVVAASQLKHRPPLVYQRGVDQNCVGMWLAKAIWMAWSLATPGYPPAGPIPSPSWLYWIARKQELTYQNPGFRTPIANRGCYPRLAMQAVQNVGFVPWSDWPYDDAFSIDHPPFGPGTDVPAYAMRELRYYRVGGSGGDRISQITSALSFGMPVGVGMSVDAAFARHVGEEPVMSIDLDGPIGGHMMGVGAVDADGTATLLNHWAGHGYDGDLVRISADVLGGPAVTDTYVISALPRAGA